MAAAPSSYKAKDAAPGAVAPSAEAETAAQPVEVAEDSLFLATRPIAPIGT
jgi:hypothetical protein